MMFLLSLALLAVILLFLAKVAKSAPLSEDLSKDINVTYDKFDDLTRISRQLGTFSDERGAFVAETFTAHQGKGKPHELPRDVTLLIVRTGKRWEFIEAHQVRIVCGDERISHARDDYDHKWDTTREDDCTESIKTSLTRADLKQCLGTGQDIEIKIGDSKPIALEGLARASAH